MVYRRAVNGSNRGTPTGWQVNHSCYNGGMALLTEDFSAVEFVLCDLDGVVWLSHQPIEGSPKAIERLRSSGRRVLFVTNNSYSRIADQEAALANIGIPAVGDVVTSAQAGAALVAGGESALVCGGPGVVEALEARGARVVRDGDADAVLVGFHRNFDWERMRIASNAVRRGARFVATNDDATYPTSEGPVPGGGAIVASVAVAAGVDPVIAGKPHEPMAALVREICGPRFSARTVIMVGDRWSTDGLFADTLGCRYALVRSGVLAPGAQPDGVASIDVADLARVADVLLAT